MRIFRQGDIILREVEKLPEGETKDLGDELSMTGETGNAHVLTKVKVIEIDWEQYIQLPEEGGIMTHVEHPPLELPPLLVAKVERVRSITPYID